MHILRIGDLHERAEPTYVHSARNMRRGHAANAGRHVHEPHRLRELRGGQLLRRRHGAASSVHGRDVGPRRKLRHAVRGVDHVRGGDARARERFEHDRSHLRGVHGGHVYDDEQRVELFKLDHLRRRHVREHGGHGLERSIVYVVPHRYVRERAKPNFLPLRLGMRSRHGANLPSHRNGAGFVPQLRGGDLLPWWHDSQDHVREQRVGPRWKLRDRVRVEDDVLRRPV